MVRITLILLFFFSCSISYSQTKINWLTLKDVSFIDKWSDEVDAYFYFPTFGPSVKDLEGKEVVIRGYVLPIDPENNFYILSQNPFASCFFCGSAGPESIIELGLKNKKDKFDMDQVVTMKGILRLNKEDIYHCNYILDKAEVVKK
ncbi:DUF3299 domain-containing protein [Marivirga lumbricoides]|uniref:DUF3299 domain-containing protein n=1 Tax=Marivirga lumbricoides TaxID=1046115 RepID=A0A2T4DQJ2_9BACT|nr:DUF3299 domain-containing protein [Marivirga lumbricoides]